MKIANQYKYKATDKIIHIYSKSFFTKKLNKMYLLIHKGHYRLLNMQRNLDGNNQIPDFGYEPSTTTYPISHKWNKAKMTLQ